MQQPTPDRDDLPGLARERDEAYAAYLTHLNECTKCRITAIGMTGGHIIKLCTPARNLRARYYARLADVRRCHRANA